MLNQNHAQVSLTDSWMHYSVATVVLGGFVFVFMLAANILLQYFGLVINPLKETSLSVITYFLISPIFVFVAYRISISENYVYLLLYLFIIFPPIMLFTSLSFFYIMGQDFLYFDIDQPSQNFINTFTIKILKALPVIILAPFVWISALQWSRHRLQPFRKNTHNYSFSHLWKINGDQILSHESEANSPRQIRQMLTKRWRETLWQRTAVYTSLPFIFILMMYHKNGNIDQYVVIGIIFTFIATATYYLVSTGLANLLETQNMKDVHIALIETIPIASWTILPVIVLSIIWKDSYASEIEITQMLLVTALWGIAITLPASMASTRLVASHIPRIASLLIICWAFYIYASAEIWSIITLMAFFFAALSLVLSYFSYIRNLNQVVATFERDEATRRAEREYQIRHSLVRKIGHDLRNIHYSILLLANRLEVRHENISEEMGIVREGIQYANDLFNDIQNANFLGIQTPQTEPIRMGDLLTFVSKTFSEQARANGIEINFIDSNMTINTDIMMMERILRNILSNAIKHSGCTKILLGTRRKTYKGQRFCEIWVIDNGNGAEFLSKIPETENTALTDDNTGPVRSLKLGLHIIRDLCSSLNYTYHTRQKREKGTAFIVSIPL